VPFPAPADPAESRIRWSDRPGPAVQTKLVVGAVDDPSEREADRMADVVSRLIERGTGTEPPGPRLTPRRLARSPDGGGGDEGGELDPDVAAEVRRSRGAPLDTGTRAAMEGAFGSDFGQVRIHRSSAAAPRIAAAAFTVGGDVHFAPGRYAPGTRPGRWLLAHELAHVVQQTGRVSRRPAQTMIRRRGGGREGGQQGGGRADGWIDELPEPLQPGVRLLVGMIRTGEITVSPAQAGQLRRLLQSLVLAMSGETGEGHQGPAPPNTIPVSLVVSLVLGRNVSALFRGCDVLVVAGPGRGLPAITARTGPDIDTVFHDMVFGPTTGAGSGLGPLPTSTQPPRLLQIEAPPVDVGPTPERRPKDVEAFLARYARAPELAKNVLEATGMDIAAADLWMGCTRLGWDDSPLAALVGEFKKAPGGLSVADWTTIATCHPALANKSGDVAKLARVGNGWTAGELVRVLKCGWTADSVLQLLLKLVAKHGGLSARDWADIAAAHTALAGNVADVCAFAQSECAWPGPVLAALAAEFATKPAGLSAAQWVAVARALGKDRIDASVATGFARVGWTGPKAKELAARYVAKDFGLAADHWIRIATLLVFKDKPGEVAVCAATGATWSPDRVVELATVWKGLNSPSLQLTQFTALAGLVANDDVDALRAFGGVGWAFAKLKVLITNFVKDRRGLDADQWAEIAASSDAFKDKPPEVTAFVYLDGWSAGPKVALAKAFGLVPAAKSAEWIAIAKAPGLADDAAAVAAFTALGATWKAPQITALVKAYGGGKGELDAAGWITIANAHPKLKDTPNDVAEFARVGHGWAAANLATVAKACCLKPVNLVAAGWAAIAKADALKDQDATVIAIAQVGNGWSSDKLAALALGFVTADGGLQLAEWVALARVNGGLKNKDDAVCQFARVGNGWTAKNLTALARQFGQDAKNRSATEWCDLAKGHASLTTEPDVVAALARAGWTAVNVTSCCTNLVAACSTDGIVGALFGVDGVAADAKAMLDGAWPAADLGTYLGTCLAKGATAGTLAGLLAIAGAPAATRRMVTNWSVAGLGAFTGRALEQEAGAQSLADAMNTPNFALRSFNLLRGTWTAESAGNFCGAALYEGLGVAELFATIDDQHAPAAMRALPSTDWSEQEIGELTAGARLKGIDAADFRVLLNTPNFRTGIGRMKTAAWTPLQIGECCGAAMTATLSRPDLVSIVNTPNFGTNSKLWLDAGLEAQEVGTIVGAALAKPIAFVDLVTFLGTAGAAAAGYALNGNWTVTEIGTTIGYCLTRVGPPTEDELVKLMKYSSKYTWAALWVQTAAYAEFCGAPEWNEVIVHVETFAKHWTGPRVGLADEADLIFPGLLPGPYRVQIAITGERKEHVEQGHTFEYFDMTYANCTRVGVWDNGFCSFFAVGTNVATQMKAARAHADAKQLADDAKHSGGFEQGTAGPHDVGLEGGHGSYGGGPQGLIHRTKLTQCFPNGGTNIRGRNLVAIGRLMGEIG
jgi:hypothetical protein